MKGCVKIVVVAADGGIIPVDDVIAIAGTGWGATTAAVIRANSCNKSFRIKVREILVTPRNL
jgi:hypothetical protein